ncbi:hypothetical protein QEV83_08555 [Methylocapsa sp. D3K7]|uniref:hypothetical protein n=1 Tax=Methylocapsa sp. D3K7 TaxID=3041435 RepID=UPI00244EBF99|nr:hypothetical protein [Methylocapsa sp. D3K7]WGJ16274.1 hypothetical protein QEV83_08555 [Methylocapsa sp. D3K7]
MASDEKPAGTNFASSSVVVAALVAAGTSFFVNHEVPLHGLRPAMTESQFHQSSTSQDIEARLWQDPFAAIAKTIDAPGTAERCGVNLGGTAAVSPASHCLSPLAKETDKAKLETTQVIAVTLPGAPYMEDGEVRRRTRYAVSSGLERAGFVPEDEHHLGYFQPRVSDLTLPDVVPYEWFARTGSDQSQARHILVLWVNEDALHGTPLRKLAGLTDALRPGNMRGAPVTIAGPYSSSLLLDMAKEACMPQFAEDVARVKPLSFYAYGATVDEKELYKQVPGCNISPELTVHEFFSNLGISLYRTTATDEVLARGIVEELKLRKIVLGEKRPKANTPQDVHHIALISEWDSFYGQTLPKTMARGFEDKTRLPEETAKKSLVHRLTYMRGLDGQLPGAQETADRKAGKGTSDASKQASLADVFKTQPDAKDGERPNGQGQQDYLRRLADRLRNLDDSLRQKKEGGISAIGILGSDVFDKLLVLRALAPQFPEAVFFTTDFDASLTLPSELDFTRNLIISSSFGPELRPEIQGEIPPFRSSYQTAAFLATSLAVGAPRDGREPSFDQEKISAWLSPSRIFEIGRTGEIIQYEGKPADFLAGTPQNRDHKSPAYVAKNTAPIEGRSSASPGACGTDLWACGGVQPPIESLFSEPENLDSISVTLAAASIFILLTLCSRRVREHALVEVGLVGLIAAAAAAACYNWGWIANRLTEYGDGEPMALLQGVSVWPTVLLRALGVVLSVYLLWRAWRKLDENLCEIAQELNLPNPSLAITAARKGAERQTVWKKLASLFSYSLREHQPDPSKPYRINIAWCEYVYQSRWAARLVRVVVYTTVMYCLWFLVLSPLLGHAVSPRRGEFARHVLRYTSKAEIICTMAVIYVVFDATWLCLRFVRDLCRSTTEWPAQTRTQFEDRLGLEPRFIDKWIDLDFVAKRTRCIGTLIYYPFLLIALVIVTRSTVFANYTPNPKILVFQGTCLAIVFGCAIALCWAAQSMRKAATQRLMDGIICAKGPRAKDSDDGADSAGQLETLLVRIEGLREGAFSPFSQQPLVRALLLPVGSFGWTTLLENGMLPGL